MNVMDRYRGLGSTLEASRVVLWEFCGPVWTYARGKGSLEPPVPTTEVSADVPTGMSLQCEECGRNPREGRYKLCSACRKAAYRERSK